MQDVLDRDAAPIGSSGVSEREVDGSAEAVISAAVMAATAFRLKDVDGVVEAMRVLVKAVDAHSSAGA